MSSNQTFRIGLLSDPARGAARMSCAEAGCENERNGWALVLDPDDAKHADAMRFIEGHSGRKYIKLESEEAPDWVANHGASQGITDYAGKLATIAASVPRGFALYIFPPGQQCFRIHVDREVVFAHADVRRNVRIHERFQDYREHWDEEAYRVNQMVQRG